MSVTLNIDIINKKNHKTFYQFMANTKIYYQNLQNSLDALINLPIDYQCCIMTNFQTDALSRTAHDIIIVRVIYTLI